MFRAIGSILVLFTIVHLFAQATASFEAALVATFDTLQTAAVVSQENLNSLR